MFTIFDIIILTILFASSIMGFYRGMLYITINLLGFIASILLAMFLYTYVKICPKVQDETYSLISYLLG